jgi:hypothetical protein
MRTDTMRKTWVALALVASILACKGESPTAPAPGPGPNPPPGGTTPPPAGVEVTFIVSNSDPLVDSTVTATATVTNNGAAVPNGTAVEFTATGGSYGVTGQSLVKTTTNGVASITLSSSVAGNVVVRAIVNNIVRTATVTFRAKPIVQPPASTVPTISSVTPPIGRPGGGETVVITGTNFRTPVRVLFSVDGGAPQEVFVVSATSTRIEVLSPGVNLPTGEQAVADVIVITEAGSANEQRVEASEVFTFRGTVLTPRIATITPNSGPVTGNTRVSIIGDGFQAPVQVLFGTAEARVIDVEYSEIVVETPAARDTSSDGSGLVLGPVPVVVRNINSQLSATSAEPFNYKSAVDVIAAGPTQGPSTGGTQIEITGHGFVGQVAVTVAGVAAQPIFVSGTRIIAITSAVDIEGCEDESGPIIVTNLANGDSDIGPEFTYDVQEPVVINVTPNEVVEGGVVTVTVANAQPGLTRFKLGDRTVFAAGTVNEAGIGTYTVTAPFNLEFDTEECNVGGVAGVRQIPITVDVTYESVGTGCEDTATGALTITPTDTACDVPPAPEVAVGLVPSTGGCVTPPTTAVGVTDSTARINITNNGTAPLTVSAAAPTGPAAANYSITPPNLVVAPGGNSFFTVSFTPSAVGLRSATVALTTNDADEETINICLNGSGS